MEIRRIEPGDENWVSNLIRKTISISNIKDYPIMTVTEHTGKVIDD